MTTCVRCAQLLMLITLAFYGCAYNLEGDGSAVPPGGKADDTADADSVSQAYAAALVTCKGPESPTHEAGELSYLNITRSGGEYWADVGQWVVVDGFAEPLEANTSVRVTGATRAGMSIAVEEEGSSVELENTEDGGVVANIVVHGATATFPCDLTALHCRSADASALPNYTSIAVTRGAGDEPASDGEPVSVPISVDFAREVLLDGFTEPLEEHASIEGLGTFTVRAVSLQADPGALHVAWDASTMDRRGGITIADEAAPTPILCTLGAPLDEHSEPTPDGECQEAGGTCTPLTGTCDGSWGLASDYPCALDFGCCLPTP